MPLRMYHDSFQKKKQLCYLPDVPLFYQPVHNKSGHYNTELFTEVAQRIIAEHNSSTPLFLYIAHEAVHSGNLQDPLQAPKRLVDVSKVLISKHCMNYTKSGPLLWDTSIKGTHVL